MVCPAPHPETEPRPGTEHRHFDSLLSPLSHTLCGKVTLTKYNKTKLPHAVIARHSPSQMGHVHEKSEGQAGDKKGAM